MRTAASFLLFAVLLLALAPGGFAALRTETVLYKQGEAVLEGYLSWSEDFMGKRPGVLVVHDWMGPSPFLREVADKLAKMGYVAFAADIYGQGVRPKNQEEASATAAGFRKDRGLLRARAQAALDTLLGREKVDPARVAAIGYCFGGSAVLELARSGAPLAGVVSFHGALDTLNPPDARNIKGKVLVLHGADDPFVPPEQVAGFEKEMREANVDWQLTMYGGAVHAFTLPGAGNDNSRGSAYNEKADRRSWEAMKAFFAEIFK